MSTEEFVLIPRPMFIEEQREVAQILQNPEIQNPGKQLSLLQRNSKPQTPPASIEFSLEQQTDNVTTADEENQSMIDNINSKVLYDIDFLQGEKFQKEKKILETINDSEIISVDNEGNLIFSNENTEVSASTFLYALQQTSSKLTDVHYHILHHLNIPTQFTCNTYAKNS